MLLKVDITRKPHVQYVNIIISAVAGIFLSSFYLKQLGSTEYGIYESISSFINYLVLFEFGTGTIITRNLTNEQIAHLQKIVHDYEMLNSNIVISDNRDQNDAIKK